MAAEKSVIPVSTVIAATVKERKIHQSELNPRLLAFCGDYEAYEVKEIFHKAFDLKRIKNGKTRKRKAAQIINPAQIIAKRVKVYVQDQENSNKWIQITINTCKKLMDYMPELKEGGCERKPDDWEYTCGAKTNTCIYYVECRLEDDNNVPPKKQIRCLEHHFFTGWTCCDIQCP